MTFVPRFNSHLVRKAIHLKGGFPAIMDGGNPADTLYGGNRARILSVTVYRPLVMKNPPLSFWIRRRATASERGASAVEFAILAPLFFMIVFGMFSGGIAYNEQSNLTHSSREGARYGAVLALSTFNATAGCSGNGGGCWANSVRDTTINRAFGDLNATVTNRSVCVALVEGSESSTDINGNAAHGHVVNVSGQGNYFSYTGPGSPSVLPCFDDTGADSGQRVQVRVTRPGSLNAVLFNVNFTLTSNAAAKFEVAGS